MPLDRIPASEPILETLEDPALEFLMTGRKAEELLQNFTLPITIEAAN